MRKQIKDLLGTITLAATISTIGICLLEYKSVIAQNFSIPEFGVFFIMLIASLMMFMYICLVLIALLFLIVVYIICIIIGLRQGYSFIETFKVILQATKEDWRSIRNFIFLGFCFEDFK